MHLLPTHTDADRTRRGLRHGCRGHAQRHSSAAALAGRGLCHLGACEKWLQFLKTPACPRSPRLPCRLAPAPVGPHSQGAQKGCAGQRWNPGHRPPLGGINTTRPAVSRRPGAALKTGPHPHRFLPLPRRWLWSSHQHLSLGLLHTTQGASIFVFFLPSIYSQHSSNQNHVQCKSDRVMLLGKSANDSSSQSPLKTALGLLLPL